MQPSLLARFRKGIRPSLPVVVLILLALLFLAPFLWLLSTALKTLAELAAYPIHWLPLQAQWGNFQQALTRINFSHYLINTLFLAGIFAILTTMSSAFVGFGFARLHGPGKQVLFFVMLATIMLPPIITLIPTYILFSKVGLTDTYWPWVLWGLASTPTMTFLFRQFFAGIPKELEEAAIVDGCGYFRIFWQIFLPLSLPVLVTVAVLSFTFIWGDWLAPKLLLTGDNTTLGVAISTGYNNEQNRTFINILSAGTILYMLPVLGIFFVAQRYYVRGVATSGLK